MAIIQYIIADDHKIFRQGLKMTLADDHKIKCTGEAANGTELLRLLEQAQPEVILLDLKMPEMDGLEVLKEIRTRYEDLKVIVLTMFDDEHFILHMMEAGANGYLLKNAEPAEIKNAIHAAVENGYYFNDLVNTVMLRKIVQQNRREPRFREEIKLNEKETEILKLICQEHTAAEIGKMVFLSPRTVEGIRSVLLEKIGVRNTAGLVMYAVKNGIVS
ncbi:response regulator transcription factor [Taibaiella chishuiensis]|uniref:LuxR family two component transcriptional regulator n=1 Tax=Taibaiella chishuiensis TaxID=1434707 RepID=A0A2P8D4K5_9BACT|nr:response regulator transcription factor [Taibaiella chishuiensis]PSK92154.1 LuxR family two component transcriptional regulator [Taibaiella chishuiensis]